MKPPELAHTAIAFLNGLLQTDPEAVRALVETRVPCNEAMAQHPSVQVSVDDGVEQRTVGLLGILNGLIGVDDDGWGFLAAEFDDEGKLTRFLLTPPRVHR